MENVTDLVADVQDKVDVVVGAAATGAAWATSKFEWWKGQSKLVRVGVFVGVFLAVAFTLSAVQAAF